MSLGMDLTVGNRSLHTQLNQGFGKKIKLLELKEEKMKEVTNNDSSTHTYKKYKCRVKCGDFRRTKILLEKTINK